jgi:hypothetical protein
MPRGRPKGSKNKNTKISIDFETSSSNVWGVKEVGENGIIWHHPLVPPFLSKEEANKTLEERVKSKDIKSVTVVNMVERAKTFHKISVDHSKEGAILPLSTDDGELDGTETEDTVASV